MTLDTAPCGVLRCIKHTDGRKRAVIAFDSTQGFAVEALLEWSGGIYAMACVGWLQMSTNTKGST